MGTTIVVSIGRNVASEPMGADAWASFKAVVAANVATAGFTIVFKGTGTGFYDGATEDSHTIVATHPANQGSMSSFNASVSKLRQWLRQDATAFLQNSIALTVGTTQFVAGAACTGHVTAGSMQHDGDTCPVHEA